MRTVYKYVMHQPVEVFEIPAGGVVLDVASQDGVPCLWVLVDPEEPDGVVRRTFIGYGTGHPIADDDKRYVGTAHDVDGAGLVFHVFEVPAT